MDGPPEDTICAVATPAGEGGIGIVRLSGPGALAVAEQIVRLRSRRSLRSAPSHTLHLADILAPDVPSAAGGSLRSHTRYRDRVIDEGLVVFMKGPRSFTAEDVVEMHCHGNGLVLGRVAEACISAGARLAQPGEFTKRAFLNGRLDLTQAEAVLDTIKAKSEQGLKVAQRHLRGDLGKQVDRLRARIVGILAQVEAGIDFVEEDISFIGRQALIAALEEALDEIRVLLRTAESGRVLREGARVVIVGRPNVGKSSLLNRLVGDERAIVTHMPGTTRDVIEESMVLDGLMITLVDTAGLRETTDMVEQEGIKRTRAAREHGDLVLYVLDAAELAEEDLDAYLAASGGRTDMVLINKSDLVNTASLQRLTGLVEGRTDCLVLQLSARTGSGLDEVKRAIRSQLSRVSLESDEGVVLTNVRHRLAVERAALSLREALDATRKAVEPEFVAMDLRGAADALGEITGVITSDEILDTIFSQFCIGK
jgi:tRNA modification GTPase